MSLQRRRLGEVCKILNGGTPKTGVPEYWDGVHQWVTPAEMGKRVTPYISQTERSITDKGLQDSSARLLPSYSVVLSSRAPIGHLIINTVPMATNQGCKGLVPLPGLDHKFLYYYLLSIVDVLNDLGSGATFKELSGAKLAEVQIPLSQLEEQRRIVALLDEAFEGIATAKANAEKNLQNAREVFESQLRSEFESSHDFVSLSEIATDITDGDHMPPPKSQTGVPFITISDIDKKRRRVDLSKTFFVPAEYFSRLKPNRKPRCGDVLYTVTGATLGIPVLVGDDSQFCFQRHIALIRPKPTVNSAWLCYAMSSPQVFRQATNGATGAAQKTVSLSLLRRIRVPLVPSDEQVAVVSRLDDMLSRTAALENLYQKKLTALDELKQSLLHQAFSGAL